MTIQADGAQPSLATFAIVAPTLPAHAELDLSEAAALLYAAGGLSRPMVLETHSPEAIVHAVATLEGNRPLASTLLGLPFAQSVLSLAVVIPALATGTGALSTAALLFACPMLLSALAWLQSPYVQCPPWLRWAAPAVTAMTAAGTAAATHDAGSTVSLATIVGLVAVFVHAGELLAMPLAGRLRLCRQHSGLWQAVGWRGILFGVKPTTTSVVAALGRDLAIARADPLTGRLARDGQPRVRRHEECARRIEAEQQRIDRSAGGAQGLGCGLPVAFSLWLGARGDAATSGRYLDLPQDACGMAVWESGLGACDGREDLAALTAARTIEAQVDAIWLLQGVAVVLRSPSSPKDQIGPATSPRWNGSTSASPATMSGPLTPSPGLACSGHCGHGRRCWRRKFRVRSREPDAKTTFVSLYQFGRSSC